MNETGQVSGTPKDAIRGMRILVLALVVGMTIFAGISICLDLIGGQHGYSGE
jgi:hypothetical protein